MNEGVTISINMPLEMLALLDVERLTALATVFAMFGGVDAKAIPRAISITAAASAKPAAPRRAPTATPNHWATPEVRETLVRMYPSTEPFFNTEAIQEAMRACGGPPLPAWSTIGVYAIQTLHLRRGKAPAKPPPAAKARDRSGRPALRAVEPVVAFVAPTTAPGTALPPVDADWATIQREALRQGYELRSHSDITMYNRTRIARGESPFAIRRAAQLMRPKPNGFAVLSDWR